MSDCTSFSVLLIISCTMHSATQLLEFVCLRPCHLQLCPYSGHIVTPQQPTLYKLASELFARICLVRARSASHCCACRLYLSKLNFYRQRQWSCQVTGKQGLTYEEAATSEQKIKNATSQVSTVFRYDSQPRSKPSTLVATFSS